MKGFCFLIINNMKGSSPAHPSLNKSRHHVERVETNVEKRENKERVNLYYTINVKSIYIKLEVMENNIISKIQHLCTRHFLD